MTTYVTWIAFLLVIYLWVSLSKARADLEDAQYTASRLENQLRGLDERVGTLSNTLSSFRVDYLREQGELKFEPEMTVSEVLKLHPKAQDVLASFHLGGCAMCAIGDTETLAQAAASHGRPLDQILTKLNELEFDA